MRMSTFRSLQHRLPELTVLGWNGAGGMAAESLWHPKLFATTSVNPTSFASNLVRIRTQFYKNTAIRRLPFASTSEAHTSVSSRRRCEYLKEDANTYRS